MITLDLTHFPADRSDEHSAMIICPGGGYWRHTPNQTDVVAKWLNSIGISAFLLRYPLKPAQHPAQLYALQTAIRTIRNRSAEYKISRDKVGVIGFSAGGHLTTMAASMFDNGDPESTESLFKLSCRPDAIVLCYPVISLTEFKHEGTVENLLGEKPDETLAHNLSGQNNATSNSPPAFIWHTADDPTVPVENSLLFAKALSANNVPFELHIFPHGDHGVGLAVDDPVLSQWTILAELWLKKRGF